MNGVDVRMFQPGPHSARVRGVLGTVPGEVVIGHVARFMPVKNHMLLVNAMARVARVRSNCRLALIGDGVLRPHVEHEVSRLGIQDRVAFLGHLTDLPAVYRDLDIAVLSSVSEATSISILEAMASGLPVVATAVGGTPELLAHGEAGLLVPSEDADALADALVRLVDSVGERRRLGQAARERAVALFSEDAMLDAYEELYSGAAAPAWPRTPGG
jgi:glycosyltransferase involved in cell wall biosynthesis